MQSSRRAFLKGTGSAVLAAALGNTAAAAPVESARAGGARVHVIQTGHVKVKETQIEGCGHGRVRRLGPILDTRWSQWLPTYAWAIEHKEGVIVVDTGQATHLKSLPAWHPYFQLAVQFRIEPEEEVGPQLRALGIGRKDVRKVVLTHVHIDHDAGLSHFPHSQILASAGEIKRASGLAGEIRGYLPERWPSWFDPSPIVFEKTAFGPFDRSLKLTMAGDVIALPTPGHTPDHLSVAVLDGETILFLAGDASYAEHQMLAGIVDGVSPEEAPALATLGKIRHLAKTNPLVYLPTHDPGSAHRLETRKLTNLAKAA
ncbi:N-acyl homoserine lactonase family protein [Bradyrhizobium commune]|uniref:N-acyl homoserine lactonase family protein n=1 Tax=Bradyrhizobium commune TaxID=83627 RepID=UPI001AED77BD|nr:N-acyl homoserine lactonase family protein [Bradyrhizobium commune]